MLPRPGRRRQPVWSGQARCLQAVVSSTMEDLGGTVLTAAGAFAATNLDDLLVLSVLFLSARTRPVPRLWRIWVGQSIGIGILTGVAAAAALALNPVPVEWVGFLGLVPLALGSPGWKLGYSCGLRRARGHHHCPLRSHCAAVPAVIFAACRVLPSGTDMTSGGFHPDARRRIGRICSEVRLL